MQNDGTTATVNSRRFCSRCKLELTDLASREAGVGPICRQKSNCLFARTIPVDTSAATALFMSADPEMFADETRKRFLTIRKAFEKKIEELENRSDRLTKGADFRKIVEGLEWMLSFEHPKNHLAREIIIRMIEALGYVGLASILRGEASTGKAELKFENGRIYLRGSRNSAGWNAMRAVPGIVRPSKYGQNAYSAPAHAVDVFIKVAMKHWPLFKGDPEQIKAQAAAWLANNNNSNNDSNSADSSTVASTVSAATTTALPTVEIYMPTAFRSSTPYAKTWLEVRFRWDPNHRIQLMKLVNEFKQLPRGKWWYVSSDRKWKFKTMLLPNIKEIAVKEGFNVSVIR